MTNPSLIFHRLSSKTPKDNMHIVFIYNDRFNSTSEIVHGTVEFSWAEIDNGCFTGTTYDYDENELQPPNSKLLICVDGLELEKDVFWAETEPFWNLVEKLDKKLGL